MTIKRILTTIAILVIFTGLVVLMDRNLGTKKTKSDDVVTSGNPQFDQEDEIVELPEQIEKPEPEKAPEPVIIEEANEFIPLEGDIYATYFNQVADDEVPSTTPSDHYADFASMRSEEVANPRSETNQAIVQSMINKRRERMQHEATNQ